VIDTTDRRTLQIGLTALIGTTPSSLNVQAAGTVIATIPIVVILVIFERHIVRGLGAGAVKG
jgi:ABC-type glycerol-3-phosphate transport system permease component